MRASNDIGGVDPFSFVMDRMGVLERCVCIANHYLAHVLETMLEVLRISCSIGDKSYAHDVQAVKLVNHRDEECAVVRPEVNETS